MSHYMASMSSPSARPASETCTAAESELDTHSATAHEARSRMHRLAQWLRSLCRSADAVAFHPVYHSEYRPARMWDRGECKAYWVSRIVIEDRRLASLEQHILKITVDNWILHLWNPAFVLVLIPYLRWNGQVMATIPCCIFHTMG